MKNRDAARVFHRALLAGVAAGLAFSSRYAFLPLLGLGVIFLLTRPETWSNRMRAAGLFGVGFFLPAGAVLGRNRVLTGAFLPHPNASQLGLLENALGAAKILFGNCLLDSHPAMQLGLLGFATAGIAVILLARKEERAGLKETLFSPAGVLLALWSGLYLVFLIGLRSRSHFDPIDSRLVAPAGLTLAMLWSIVMARVAKLRQEWLALFGLCLILIAVGRDARVAFRIVSGPLPGDVAPSERLAWIRENSGEGDLIIGDNTVDIPFYLGHRRTLSFSPYPYTDRPSYSMIEEYGRVHCGEYQSIYVVLRKPLRPEYDYGGFFANLAAGRIGEYPRLSFIERLRDGVVFQLNCRE